MNEVMKIKIISCFKAGKSQYMGESQFQIEFLLDGKRQVQFITAKTVKEAKIILKDKFQG